MLPWLPVVLALSANSPYLEGEDTGLRSTRAEVLVAAAACGRAAARSATFAEWETFVERLVALRARSPTTRALWWDIRAHPRFGTLEIRMPDQPTDARVTDAFVALVQALCAVGLGGRAARRSRRATAPSTGRTAGPPRGSGLARISSTRTGLAVVPARELADELLELVAPAAERLGTLACSTARRRPLRGGPPARGRARDGLDAVCADLVARSLASA